MKKKFELLFVIIIVFSSCSQNKDEVFHFYVATDVHMNKQRVDYTNYCFRDQVLADIKKDSAGIGKFVIVTGDLDPFFRVKESVEQVMGPDYRFYPVIGNHDVGMTNNNYKKFPDANWGNAFDIVKYNKKELKNIVNWGPSYRSPALDSLSYTDSISGKKYISTYDSLNIIGSKYTSYSFDEGNSHFVVLDIYAGLRFKGAEHNGRISNELYDWLARDLSKTNQENIFVFAHQPVWNSTGEEKWHVLLNEWYELKCRDFAREYGADSLKWFDKEYTQKITPKDKFWDLLKKHKVVAYFCGHTHHYSAVNVEGVWEINLQFSGWCTEGKTKYGEVIVDKDKVELLVKGFIEKTEDFEVIDRILLKE